MSILSNIWEHSRGEKTHSSYECCLQLAAPLMQKWFLGCSHTPSHLLKWHSGSSEILGFISLMYTCQMIIGRHGQAITVLQGPLLLEVSRKRLPTSCLISLWDTLIPWWLMQRGSNTSLLLGSEKSESFQEKKKKKENEKKKREAVTWKYLKSSSTSFHCIIWLWSSFTVISFFICQGSFHKIYSCIWKEISWKDCPAMTTYQEQRSREKHLIKDHSNGTLHALYQWNTSTSEVVRGHC